MSIGGSRLIKIVDLSFASKNPGRLRNLSRINQNGLVGMFLFGGLI